jgi:hypothetical protein
MSVFSGAYGDKRRAASVGRLHDSMVAQSSVVVRRLGGRRAGEMAGHRVLSCTSVTPGQTVACFARVTAAAAAGRRIVAAQDTTECNYPTRRRSKLGPAGHNGDTPGFFLHAMIAVDVADEAVLGVVDAAIWTRPATPAADRRKRAFADKESHRWLAATKAAGSVLAAASQIVVVGDRESDIYQVFDGRPANVELVVRVAQNRNLADGSKLFEPLQALTQLGCQTVQIPPRRIGEAGRVAKVVLAAGQVTIHAPRNGRREPGSEAAQTLTLVEVVEIDPPVGETALHWRLLTTLPADTLEAAQDVVGCYRLRWRIEQSFRMLKSDGLQIEDSQTTDTHRLFNLATLALGAAVRIIQLVDARDGSNRPASDVATEAEIAAARKIGPTLEGRTERQKNPHPPGNLAWLAWIVARMGGWNCYYKPPGPKTMRQGWDRFAAMAQGFTLATQGLTLATQAACDV